MSATATSRRRKASAVSAAVVAALAVSVLPAAAAQAHPHPAVTAAQSIPSRYADQKLDWQPCQGDPSLECATMTVPRDWHHPDAGPDLTIAVSRHKTSDPAKRRGVLMMAAGGPGGKGLLRPGSFAKASPSVAAVYDVVSFDQRGVGRSTHAVCQSDAEFPALMAGDSRDRSPAAIQGVLERSRKFVNDCQERSGGLLPYLTTEQTVRDMDLYRTLLGAPKISYYGASYATTVGAYYATLFPQRVERAVLDSNIGFDSTMEQWMTGQPKSFQRRFEQDFLPWLAKYDSVYHYGRTVAEAKANWERRRAALHDHPLDLGSAVLDPNLFDAGTSSAIYKATQGFPTLAGALAALDHWDTATQQEKGLVGQLFGHYPDPGFFAEYFSVTCNDTPWSRDIDKWVARSGKDTVNLPLLGARELTFASVCAYWPKSGAPEVKVTGAGLPATLMVNSTHDPATYYEGALRAHRALRGSRLVTVTGDGDHSQYQNGNACVDGVVDAYLLDGVVPKRDLTCQAKPLPVPAGAAG
ncbi:alpha/beta hydrolase [Streptomyces hesseae]|uniref:Alpha/beta hydrolase n=1 Tax=Streptomyces hesseae TaxID=3075519 RepID=A0ABU2SQJ0_9ACTN|nr:alpha/beta hydrolase [Streptomyces sp. DSM 40473]MDT0451162.1 alpha/beta hydrolase [Streptomyces sp. DSM 40473]